MTTLNDTLRLLQLQISQTQPATPTPFGAAPYHPGAPTLPAPHIPALIVHGGLNKNDLDDPTVPVAVQVVLQPSMLEHDELILYLDTTAVAAETLRQEHLDSGVLTFYLVPSVFPQEGWITLHYHHSVPLSSTFAVSESVGPFLVKQTVPGDPDPDPSTPDVNERLTAITGIPEPVPPGRALTVTLPRYVNIREHDKMILHWADKEVVKNITADEASNSNIPLAVTVPASVIDSTPGVGLIVRYEIYDTVMNWSLYSEPAYADVEPPGVLHAPSVRDANDDDELDMDELDGADVAILIPVNGNLPVGTNGVLTWTGIPVTGPRLTYTASFKIERAATRITLYVPNAKAAALVSSTAMVYYEAIINGVSTPSRRTSVAVIGDPMTLEKPTLTGVTGDSYNPNLITGSHQEVIVPSYGFMASGQAIILHWEGRTASGQPLYVQNRKDLTSDTPQDTAFLVDKTYATSLGINTLLKVYYDIMADGTTYVSPPLELTVMGVSNNLPKPTTEPVFANGEIDPDTVTDAIKVVVEPNASLAPGDLLSVKWLGRSGASITLSNQVFPNSGNLEIRIGKTPYIDGNTNGYVDVSYEARRNGQPVGSSQVLQLHVGEAAALPWPLPTLIDATGGQVSTWQPVKPGTQFDTNTATVVISDARIRPGDTVAVIWRLPDGSDLTVPWVLATDGEGRVPVPPTVLGRSMGQLVQAGCVLFRGPALDPVGSSGLTSLQIGTVPANALSELLILEATNSGVGPELDVSQLTGDANLRVGRWPLIEVGQPVWLTLTGTRMDGTSYSKVVLSPPNAVDSAWVSLGYRTARMDQSEAKGLKDGSNLTVQLKIGIRKEQNESLALAFIPKTYTVRSVSDSRPVITNVQDSKGEVANGGDTYDVQVTVSGTATPNQDIELLDNGLSKGRASVNASGNWNLGIGGLAIGSHSITARASYGSGQSSVARTFTRINLPLVVDTTQLVLSGKLYINVAGGLPNPMPAGTSARRSASGGTPPYQYTSANSNVAAVDSSGLVQSRGVGSTTITVSDSAGQRLSYSVVVSGVFLFRYAGTGQWYPPSNAGNILTRDLMAEIWAQCASHGGVAALGIPGGVYWTGTSSDGVRRYYTRNLSTGAEGTEAGQGIGTASHHMLKRP